MPTRRPSRSAPCPPALTTTSGQGVHRDAGTPHPDHRRVPPATLQPLFDPLPDHAANPLLPGTLARSASHAGHHPAATGLRLTASWPHATRSGSTLHPLTLDLAAQLLNLLFGQPHPLLVGQHRANPLAEGLLSRRGSRLGPGLDPLPQLFPGDLAGLEL